MNRRELMAGATTLAAASALPSTASAVRFPERPSVPPGAWQAWRELSRNLGDISRRYWNGELRAVALHREFADLVDRMLSLQTLVSAQPIIWHGRGDMAARTDAWWSPAGFNRGLVSQVLISENASMFFRVSPTDNLVLSLYVDDRSVGTTTMVDWKKARPTIISHT